MQWLVDFQWEGTKQGSDSILNSLRQLAIIECQPVRDRNINPIGFKLLAAGDSKDFFSKAV